MDRPTDLSPLPVSLHLHRHQAHSLPSTPRPASCNQLRNSLLCCIPWPSKVHSAPSPTHPRVPPGPARAPPCSALGGLVFLAAGLLFGCFGVFGYTRNPLGPQPVHCSPLPGVSNTALHHPPGRGPFDLFVPSPLPVPAQTVQPAYSLLDMPLSLGARRCDDRTVAFGIVLRSLLSWEPGAYLKSLLVCQNRLRLCPWLAALSETVPRGLI